MVRIMKPLLVLPIIITCLVVVVALIKQAQAVEYAVTNRAAATAGGSKFNDQIGAAYTYQVLDASTNFIWQTFQQPTAADRKDVSQVNVYIDDMDGVAGTANNEIYVSARYIDGYSGDVRTEITGVLYHEMTHVWQWSSPGAPIEGVADFVRLKAGYAPSHWVGPGGGDQWDQRSDVTARFLDYCNGLRSGFVAELNKKIRNGYSDSFFQELLGKSVDQLWTDYKALYGR